MEIMISFIFTWLLLGILAFALLILALRVSRHERSKPKTSERTFFKSVADFE